METEIKENEIGLVFENGKYSRTVKPGKHKVGLDEFDKTELRLLLKERQENYMLNNYRSLKDIDYFFIKNIKSLEKKLNQPTMLSRIVNKFRSIDPLEAKQLAEERLKEAKIQVYQDEDKLPKEVRDKLINFKRELQEIEKQSVDVKVIDLRQLTLTITGQEMLTKDKVSIRINVIAQFRVTEPLKAVTEVVDYQKRLYEQVQMIVRDYACANTLDQLLSNKNTVGTYICKQVKSLASNIGLEVIEVGLKDIILPGKIQDIMHKVVEAEREGKAKLIKAREDLAATRTMLNVAKMMKNPELIELKKMEVLSEIAKSPSATIYFGVGDKISESLKIKS